MCEGFVPADGFQCSSTRAELGVPFALLLLVSKISFQQNFLSECHITITLDNITTQREGQWRYNHLHERYNSEQKYANTLNKFQIFAKEMTHLVINMK